MCIFLEAFSQSHFDYQSFFLQDINIICVTLLYQPSLPLKLQIFVLFLYHSLLNDPLFHQILLIHVLYIYCILLNWHQNDHLLFEIYLPFSPQCPFSITVTLKLHFIRLKYCLQMLLFSFSKMIYLGKDYWVDIAVWMWTFLVWVNCFRCLYLGTLMLKNHQFHHVIRLPLHPQAFFVGILWFSKCHLFQISKYLFHFQFLTLSYRFETAFHLRCNWKAPLKYLALVNQYFVLFHINLYRLFLHTD